MVLITILFHYSNTSVKVNIQIFNIYDIIATCFRLVTQKSALGHCLHSKCQITALNTFIDISMNGYYVALNTSNVQFLTLNCHLKYHKKTTKKIDKIT